MWLNKEEGTARANVYPLIRQKHLEDFIKAMSSKPSRGAVFVFISYMGERTDSKAQRHLPESADDDIDDEDGIRSGFCLQQTGHFCSTCLPDVGSDHDQHCRKQQPSCMQSLPRFLGASDLPQVSPTRSEAVAYHPIRKRRKKGPESVEKAGISGPCFPQEPSYLLDTGGILRQNLPWRHTEEGGRVDTHKCSMVSVSPGYSAVYYSHHVITLY